MYKFIAPLLFAGLTAGSAFAAEPMQDDPRAFEGKYALADGRLLTVAEDNGTLTAQITKRGITQVNTRFTAPRTIDLKQNGIASFVSTSSPVQITFDADEKGQIAQVSVTERGAATRGLAQR